MLQVFMDTRRNMLFEMVGTVVSLYYVQWKPLCFEYIWYNVYGYASLIPGMIWVFSYASLLTSITVTS